ncbi:MAG: hypothetical protein OEV66_08955 [Spirochaetia bacterium]|nr:hypothetical protein [Spirochaetia bacterium]
MKRLNIIGVGFAFLAISVFAQEEEVQDQKISDKLKQEKSDSSNKSVDFDLILKASAGEAVNYMSYRVSSPAVDLSADGKLNVKLNKTLYMKLRYKAEGEKLFTAFPGTLYTLDNLDQRTLFQSGYSKGDLDLSACFKYNWILRPKWPDLYQPNPLQFGGTADPLYGSYLPTDRNSYHKLEPGLSMEYNGIKALPFSINLRYIRNLQYIDPLFTQINPTHLTPSAYTGYAAQIEMTYRISKKLYISLANDFEYRSYDYELARDSVTGKTNYKKTPNPLFSKMMNTSALGVLIKFGKNLSVKPFFGVELNSDLYQGYYSYTGIEPGIEVAHKIGNFRYTLKFSETLQFFDPVNSFDPLKTTDGKTLYKYYTKANLNMKYEFNKHIESFIEAGMFIKQTNYPAYVSGVNPAKKNYNIDFNFTNYSIMGGAAYKL